MDIEQLKKDIDEKAKALVEKQQQENKTNAFVEQKAPSFEDLQAKYLREQVDKGKSLSDITNDFAKAQIMSEIIGNQDGEHDKLHKQLADEQKQTLLESFKQDKITQQTQTITETQKKAEAFYTSVRPILEFDFSNLIKSKRKVDTEPKTYSERSYGIPLMCLMLALFLLPYCAVSIILAVACGVNAVCEAIATFGKISRSIVLTLLILTLAILVVYGAICGVDALFGTNIINNYIK